jgi:hypothetical protein
MTVVHVSFISLSFCSFISDFFLGSCDIYKSLSLHAIKSNEEVSFIPEILITLYFFLNTGTLGIQLLSTHDNV